MPIDADRLFARINGEGQASHQQDAPHDQCIPMAATADVAPGAEELNDNSVLGEKLEAVTAKSLSKGDEILDSIGQRKSPPGAYQCGAMPLSLSLTEGCLSHD
jgi:hypothetical protein